MIPREELPNWIIEWTSLWEVLLKETRPIVLYGMGDGALKILAACRQYGIPVSGIFTSEEFYRRKTFEGFPVERLRDLEERYEDFVILLAFGVEDDSMLDRIREIAAKHTLYAPDVPLFGEGLFTPDYVRKHLSEIQNAYALLADDRSRTVFAALVNYKLSGKISYLEKVTSTRTADISEILRLGDRESYLDVGAFSGDTVREFLEQVEDFVAIYAVEPAPKNLEKLNRFLREHPYLAVEVFPVATGSVNEEMLLTAKGGRNAARGEKGRIPVPVRRLDDLLGDKKVTYLKMDVEGMERETILGAVRLLQTHHPKLSIACYHRNEDLFDLLLLLHEMVPEYRFFFRRHPYLPAWETILYVVPEE